MRLNLTLTPHADAIALAYLDSMPARERARAYKQAALMGLALLLQQGLSATPVPARTVPAMRSPKSAAARAQEHTQGPVTAPANEPIALPVSAPEVTSTAPVNPTLIPSVAPASAARLSALMANPTLPVSVVMPEPAGAGGAYSLDGLAVDDLSLDF